MTRLERAEEYPAGPLAVELLVEGPIVPGEKAHAREGPQVVVLDAVLFQHAGALAREVPVLQRDAAVADALTGHQVHVPPEVTAFAVRRAQRLERNVPPRLDREDAVQRRRRVLRHGNELRQRLYQLRCVPVHKQKVHEDRSVELDEGQLEELRREDVQVADARAGGRRPPVQPGARWEAAPS